MEMNILKRKHEEKFNGDYRTKRVILEIHDNLAAAEQTCLPNPPRSAASRCALLSSSERKTAVKQKPKAETQS